MKLALMYSEPSSPVGLRRARDMLSTERNHKQYSMQSGSLHNKSRQFTGQFVRVAVLLPVVIFLGIAAVSLLRLPAHLVQELGGKNTKNKPLYFI